MQYQKSTTNLNASSYQAINSTVVLMDYLKGTVFRWCLKVPTVGQC